METYQSPGPSTIIFCSAIMNLPNWISEVLLLKSIELFRELLCLAIEFWKWEAEYYSHEHYDKVLHSGLLSKADVNAIAGKVWKNG